MAEVTLSDYIAYVFQEVSRARDMADRYSKEVALAYAKDDVLRHFSVPRFKIAKMDLNMPVVVSGVQVASLAQFRMDRAEFKRFVLGLILQLVRNITQREIRTDGTDALLDALHDQLTRNPDPSRPEELVTRGWNDVVQQVLRANGLAIELLQRLAAEVLSRALNELIAKVKGNTTASRGALEKLFVDPETNVVKNGSSDASVFTIKAELMEEAMFIRSVKDEKTGGEIHVVEFE